MGNNYTITTKFLYVLIRKIKTAIFHPSPDYKVIHEMSNLMQRVCSLTGKLTGRRKKKSAVAVYDLRVSPVSFDFTFFLYAAECSLRKLKHESAELTIVMICQPHQETDLMLWQDFVANVLYPLALSYPYFGSINFIHDTDTLIPHVQEKLDVFPKNYDGRFIRHFSYPEAFGYQRSMEYFSGIQVKPFARVALDQWLMAQGINRPYITVTVRNRKARDERRNTDEDLFLSVLEQNLPSEVSVVVVPDTENLALRSLSKGSYHISYQASISIFSRVALYDGARLNLFSANGPASICYFLRNCKFIVFGYGISDSAMGNIDVMQSIGLKHGEQFFCDNGSRGAIIWGESRSDLAFHVRRMLST